MKKILFITFLLLIVVGKANSQQCLSTLGCSNFIKPYPTGTFTTTSSSWTPVSSYMSGGNYTLFSVTKGNTVFD